MTVKTRFQMVRQGIVLVTVVSLLLPSVRVVGAQTTTAKPPVAPPPTTKKPSSPPSTAKPPATQPSTAKPAAAPASSTTVTDANVDGG